MSIKIVKLNHIVHADLLRFKADQIQQTGKDMTFSEVVGVLLKNVNSQ